MANDPTGETVERDRLARVRTSLANERRLLAYVRTSIMLLATGVTLLKFFARDQTSIVLGGVLVGVSIVVALVGLWRYHRVHRKIDPPPPP